MNTTQQQNYELFLHAPLSISDRKTLTGDLTTLTRDGAFDGLPAFGTGGMREIYGLGSNRLNIYTVARLNMAMADVFLQSFPQGGLIIIGYDSRSSNPVLTKLSLHILKSRGIRVKIFNRPTPTPLVSFAVLHLQAQAGIILTASHNPPEYNGYKVYWENGAQIIPPIDVNIQARFNEISFRDIKDEIHEFAQREIPQEDLIADEILDQYILQLKKEAFVSTSTKKIQVLYSPLHGNGGYAFTKVFNTLGFENYAILKEQEQPDGRFPTTKSPNPEEKQAFDLLVKAAKENPVDILIASDPDSDRLGTAVFNQKTKVFDFLSGNQIGCLLLESIASMKAKTLKNPFICKTIVTTELQRRIATAHGVKTIETLTGFKYIAEVLERDPENYLFGGEESFGYLPLNWVRDKDSISAAVALCELAEKKNLIEALDEIFIQHGLYVERLHSLKFSPQEKEKQQQLLEKLKDPSKLLSGSIATRKIVDILDLQKGSKKPQTKFVADLHSTIPPALVVQYYLEPEGRLTIRPSGTEPKVKIYLSLMAKNKATKENLQQEKELLDAEADLIIQEFLQKIK